MKDSLKRFAAIAGLLIFVSVSLAVSPGRLDQNFGTNGIVATTFPSAADHTRRVLLQPDGKILVLASNSIPAHPTATASIRRFLPNGAYDASFAGTGQLSLNGLRDFALLKDGRILTVQTIYATPAFGRVCRWSGNGAADLTFGSSGCSNVQIADRFEARRIRVHTDGKIVISGAAPGSIAVARLLSNGGLDASFGNSGVSTGYGADSDYYIVGPWIIDKTGPLEIQPDGKILYGFGQDWDSSFYVCRLNQNGSIDSSFGKTGKVSVQIPTTTWPYYEGFSFSIALQPDENILVTGTALEWWGNDSYVSVARLKMDGSFDPAFGESGVASFHSSESRGPASALVLLPNNKILLGGMDDQAFSLVRLNKNGAIDTSFGNDGIIKTPFGTSELTSILGMQLQPDGTLIAAGSTNGADYSANIGLVKYRDVGASANRTRFDFDGDGRSDVSIFRPNPSSLLDNAAPEGSSSQWWIFNSESQSSLGFTFGQPGDSLVPADYTGDGKTDVAFFRPSNSTWYVLRSEDFTFYAFPFGSAEDIPAPGDFDGDGKADPAVYRPSSGTWFVVRSSDGGLSVIPFGVAADKPIVADYDGDGKDDIGVYRSPDNQFWLLRSSAGVKAYQFGASGDRTAIGDWTGDGKADVALYRPGTSHWYVIRSDDDSFFAFPWGVAGDVPSPGDFDGDGRTDPTIWRPSDRTWYILGSTSGFQAIPFGAVGDVPVPNSVSVQ